MSISRNVFPGLALAVAIPLAGGAACNDAGPSPEDEAVEESTAAATAASEQSCDAARLSGSFAAVLDWWESSGSILTIGQLQAGLEASVAASMVAEPGCTSWSWSGLDATVTFDACRMQDTGETIDGSIGVSASLTARSLTLSFDALAVGDDSMAGTIDLAAAGDGEVTMSADLSSSVTLTDVALVHDAEGTTIDGAGSTVLASGESRAVVLTDVHVASGDCLPSSGSLAIAGDAATAVTLTFLATTPTDGVVAVQAGADAEATHEARFDACR